MLVMKQPDIGSTANEIVEGGVSAAAVAVLKQTVLVMIPFLIPAAPLIALDCIFGIKASRLRYKKYHREDDRVTFSKAFRRTVGKCFEYACWLIIASSGSVAYGKPWIQWVILGGVYLNEIVSIIGNHLFTKGIEFDLLAFLRNVLVFAGRWIASKIGIIADDVTFDDVFKPMPKGQPRNENGQFTTKKKGRK